VRVQCGVRNAAGASSFSRGRLRPQRLRQAPLRVATPENFGLHRRGECFQPAVRIEEDVRFGGERREVHVSEDGLRVGDAPRQTATMSSANCACVIMRDPANGQPGRVVAPDPPRSALPAWAGMNGCAAFRFTD
jgi:hypothetical protein